MLGKWVCRQLGADAAPIYTRMIDLQNVGSIRAAINGCDGVINCAGAIPGRGSKITDMIYLNSMFPHVLVEAAQDLPVVLVSTDCVFSGRSYRRYCTDNIPDPKDYYGKSKALGEVAAPNTSVVRTSFIGCDHGFMAWILSAGKVASATQTRVSIDGWKNALWTGSVVQAVAASLIDIVKAGPRGLIHLATEQVISKYDLAQRIIDTYGLDVELNPVLSPIINRALVPTMKLRGLDESLVEYKCA
jgi:dTDP-4-dehydrorhamnose reductase